MLEKEIFSGIKLGEVDVNLQSQETLLAYVDQAYAEGKPARARLLLRRLAAAENDVESSQDVRNGAHNALAKLVPHIADNYADFEPPGARPVPHQVHFVWFGRQPSEVALANLEAWSAKAAEANRNLPADAEPWTVNVWTDPGTAKWGGTSTWDQEVVDRLNRASVRLRTESAHVVAERSAKGLEPGEAGRLAGIWSTSLESKAFNLAADLTRYAVLEKYGGIYSDVDIAPGGVSLERLGEIRMGVDDLPLVAPRLRDETSVNQALQRDPDSVVSPDDVLSAADLRYEAGVFNNNFIVTPPESSFISSMTDDIPATYDKYREEQLAQGKSEEVIHGQLAEQAAAISGPVRWAGNPLVPKSDIERHAGTTLGITTKYLGQDVSAVKAADYKALMDPAGLEAVKGMMWVTDESAAQLDSRVGSLDQMMSASPNLATVRQNHDVIARNRELMAHCPDDRGEPRNLTAELDRALKWFGNDGLLERYRHDAATMSNEDRVAIAGVTQVCRAMESSELSPEIQRDMRRVLDGLKPAVEFFEARRGAVMTAADAGLQHNVITLSEASDIKGEGATTRTAAAERHHLIQKLADGGELDPQLVKPAVPPGSFDTNLLTKQVLRLNETASQQIGIARAQRLDAVGQAVLGSAEHFPSPKHHERVRAQFEDLRAGDKMVVQKAIGTLAMAKETLGKDKREVEAQWERAAGGPAAVLAAERGDIAALSTQVGAMEKGFLHMLSRPDVPIERLRSAAEALSGLDTLVDPRSVVPTDQKLNPAVGAGIDFTRTYLAAVDETKPAHSFGPSSATAISKDLRASLQETADHAAPEALRKGLERVERCSPELGKYVHDARLRLGPAVEGEPDRITAARTGLDQKLIELGQMDKRTRGRWMREEGPLLQEIAGNARQAHKATQRPSSLVQKVADKVGHEFAKQELDVRQQGARHHVDTEMGFGDYAQAAVKGVGKGVSQHLRSLVHRVDALDHEGPRAPQNTPPPPVHPVPRHASPGQPRQAGM